MVNFYGGGEASHKKIFYPKVGRSHKKLLENLLEFLLENRSPSFEGDHLRHHKKSTRADSPTHCNDSQDNNTNDHFG
jgi:hypothetical protein